MPGVRQDVADLGRALRRGKWILLSTTLGGLLCAVVYLLLATPQYTASAALAFDLQQAASLRASPQTALSQIDVLMLETHAETIKSGEVADRVIRDMRLGADPEFEGPGRGPISRLLFGATQSGSEQAIREEFWRRLQVRRLGASSVIEVTFRSRGAEKAARIANAVARAVIADQIDARASQLQQQAAWLGERAIAVGDQLKAARAALRAANSEGDGSEVAALQSTAAAYQSTLDTVLQRYSEVVQDQSFSALKTRIVTIAGVPVKPSSPVPVLALSLAAAAGLVSGAAAALARDKLQGRA